MGGAESGLRPWHWGVALLAVLLLKQVYALATTDQLAWMLGPLVALLETVGGLSFQPLPNGEWLDAGHGVLLVKACAGGNFLLASWLGYLWRWQTRPSKLRAALAAFLAAWLTTLAANTLRILLAAHGQDGVSLLFGLSDADSHRVLGILVYFLCLWAQLSRPRRHFPALVLAAVLYLGINLGLPALRAWLLDLGPLDMRHVLWTAGVPVALVLSWSVLRLARLKPAGEKPCA